MSNISSQSLNGSLPNSPNHSNNSNDNCSNELVNGQSTINEHDDVNIKNEQHLNQNNLSSSSIDQQQNQDQPMEEDDDDMYGEEEEQFDNEDQLNDVLKNRLAGELERQLNANNSVANSLNNLNNLLANNNNGNNLLNNLSQWNPAALAALSNGNLSNFNSLAGLTQALSNAAFNGSLHSNNQNSSQNSSTGSQNNLGASLNTNSISNNGQAFQNGSNGSLLTHVEAAKGYTFEEQFKQLYELSPDKKRKDFLDDLFSFMQRRGTPVNRIPIMAKQVLDIYELYKLVVARGGLVEVINKKIWREITKGLNLPSSITSAAFTLRTQYMKYLYPYECEKEKLSTSEELQQAIDGNRREGRRSSYGQYGDLPGDCSPPQCNTPLGQNNALNQFNPLNNPQLAALAGQANGLSNLPLNLQLALAAMQSQAMNGNSASQSNRLSRRGTNGSQGATSSEDEDNASLSSVGRVPHRTPLNNGQNRQNDLALNLSGIIGQSPTSLNGNNTASNNLNGNSRLMNNDYGSTRSSSSSDHLNNGKENNGNTMDLSRKLSDDELVSPSKRFLSEDDKNFNSTFGNLNSSSTNIKIATNKDRNGSTDKSMNVSMEINGIIYSGVLFAQHSGLRA